MQRYATFAVPFGTCDFRAAQTAANFNFNTFGAQTHCVLYSTLHRTTEHHTTLQLRSDAVSNQFRVQFRFTDFGDIDLCRYASDIRYDRAQFFYVFAFFTDNDAWASGVNGHTDAFRRTLDNDARYRRFSQFFSQELTHFKIAVQVVSEFFGISEPGRVPGFNNTQSNTIRMYFLTHC